MTPERAAELADDLRFKYAMSNAARDAIQQAILAACKEERESALKDVKITIPTAIMEQEFANHYRMGFAAGKAAKIRSAE